MLSTLSTQVVIVASSKCKAHSVFKNMQCTNGLFCTYGSKTGFNDSVIRSENG
jgi:hypothetical protein